MKSRTLMCITAAVLFAALVIPVRIAGQEQGEGHHRYKLIDLGTFGGPQSSVNIPVNYDPVLNDQSTLTGKAETSTPDPYPNFCFNGDCLVSHAFQWQNGVITDLGVLGGVGSSQGDSISANGLIVGVSENGEFDPSTGGSPQNRAVLWKNGQITDLGTLPGGYESLPSGVNSRGQVVGAATNGVPDANSILNCCLNSTTQTRAFLWQNGVMQDLGTLDGGTDAEAFLVSEQGQIIGESYISSTPSPFCAGQGLPLASGAFLWEHGTMTNLGSFGGTCTFASDLNNRGQVVGLSTLTGDQFHAFLWDHGSLNDLPNTLGGNNSAAVALNNGGDVVGFASLPGDQDFHASLWKNNAMTDLGTVDGDPCSIGFSVNATEQVVGQSVPACDFSQARAFLWEKGSIVDLNALIPPDSTLFLTSPETINDRGEIAGNGVDANGNEHAFLLIPCSAEDTACQDAAPAPSTESVRPVPAAQPPTETNQGNPLRQILQHRLGVRRLIGTPLSGAAAISGPNATLSPTSLSFRCRNVPNAGCQCITGRTTTLSNLGNAPLSIQGITVTGAFSETNNCGTSLGAGKSCTISVGWALKNSSGSVSVSDNAPGSPQKVSLSGIKTCTPL